MKQCGQQRVAEDAVSRVLLTLSKSDPTGRQTLLSQASLAQAPAPPLGHVHGDTVLDRVSGDPQLSSMEKLTVGKPPTLTVERSYRGSTSQLPVQGVGQLPADLR